MLGCPVFSRARLFRLLVSPLLLPLLLTTSTAQAAGTPFTSATASCPAPDYSSACLIPADPSNYTPANRPHDYPIDMIVIHDIEGDAATAIQDFQTPSYRASAHYVVDYNGSITQMVREKDIAWHAGNWDYNTRSIGIEHAGYACCNYYTTAEYNASAALAASICSRYGVPMDRTHVIGHDEVPDPNNPALFGGSDHHTDPGPYWNWTYYIAQAQADTKLLPSPPHIMPDPVAVNGLNSVTVTWTPARTCRAAAAPITGYTITGQPGSLSVDVPATATSYTFDNLTPDTTYTFTVTAHNTYGDGAATSNPATPGRCATVGVGANPASPQTSGTRVQLTATSTGCPNPNYEYWLLPPGSTTWQLGQAYGTSPTFTWNTAGLAPGPWTFSVWARDAASPGNGGNVNGTWDASGLDRGPRHAGGADRQCLVPCSDVPVRDVAARLADVAGRAAIFRDGNLQLEHQPRVERHVSLGRQGSRQEQRRSRRQCLRNMGLLLLDHVHADRNAMHVGGGEHVTVGNGAVGGSGDDHRDRVGLPQSELPVRDAGPRIADVERGPAVLVEGILHLEHDRCAAGHLPIHRQGTRREQPWHV